MQRLIQLEQLEHLRSENTPRRPLITHTIDSYQIPSQNKTESKLQIWKKCQKFKLTTLQHTFGSCLKICLNMKWIWLVLWKLQSGHDSVHRQIDGQTNGRCETSIPHFQLRWNGGYNNY